MNLLHINGNIGLDKIWNTVRSLRSDMLYHIWDMNTGLYKQCSSENLGKSKRIIILKLVFCMPMWWLTLCCVCNKVYLGIAHPPLIFTQCKSFLLNMHFLVYSKYFLVKKSDDRFRRFYNYDNIKMVNQSTFIKKTSEN